jgi:hypothetical protein
VQCHFEDGIAAQHVAVIAVGIAGDNRQHAKAQDLIEPMGNLARLPRILQEEDPYMIYHPSSPWGDGKPWADETVGDMHQWHSELPLLPLLPLLHSFALFHP